MTFFKKTTFLSTDPPRFLSLPTPTLSCQSSTTLLSPHHHRHRSQRTNNNPLSHGKLRRLYQTGNPQNQTPEQEQEQTHPAPPHPTQPVLRLPRPDLGPERLRPLRPPPHPDHRQVHPGPRAGPGRVRGHLPLHRPRDPRGPRLQIHIEEEAPNSYRYRGCAKRGPDHVVPTRPPEHSPFEGDVRGQ